MSNSYPILNLNILFFLIFFISVYPRTYCAEISMEEIEEGLESPQFETPETLSRAVASSNPAGLVWVEYPPDYNAPYASRRSTWGFIFSATAEQFYPTKFISTVMDGASYKSLFKDKNILMAQVELGPQLNMPLGSINTSLIYAQGSVESLVGKTTLRTTKKGFKINLNFDHLMDEPYIAPYVAYQQFQISYLETDNSVDNQPLEKGETTDWSMGYTGGVLIQMNFLDRDSFRRALVEYGLDNSFLEIFATQYASSPLKKDKNFETSFNFGIGLRLEF